jgi:hypothetical protein
VTRVSTGIIIEHFPQPVEPRNDETEPLEEISSQSENCDTEIVPRNLAKTKRREIRNNELFFPHRVSFLGRWGFKIGPEASYNLCFQSPDWLSQSIYQALAHRTLTGWQLNLKSYTVQHYDSEIFHSIQKGDTARMICLFSEGKASPWDCFPNGISLLSVSPPDSRPDKTFLLRSHHSAVFNRLWIKCCCETLVILRRRPLRPKCVRTMHLLKLGCASDWSC